MTKKKLDELRATAAYWKERHDIEVGENDVLREENARLRKALDDEGAKANFLCRALKELSDAVDGQAEISGEISIRTHVKNKAAKELLSAIAAAREVLKK